MASTQEKLEEKYRWYSKGLSMKADDNWIKNPKNKRKEFRYEIDNNTPDN